MGEDLFVLSLLGGVLALDATAVGQFMVSRPLVAGALAGWLLDDPATGFLVGTLLEIYLLVAFPVGGARFPEGATATVVAVATAAWGQGAGALAIGVAVALVWGQLGGVTISTLRSLNADLAPDPTGGSVAPGRVLAGHLSAIALDFLRAFFLTAAGVVVGRWVVTGSEAGWLLGPEDTVGFLLVGGAVSTGVLLRSFGGFRRRRLLFGAGLAVGVVGAILL